MCNKVKSKGILSYIYHIFTIHLLFSIVLFKTDGGENVGRIKKKSTILSCVVVRAHVPAHDMHSGAPCPDVQLNKCDMTSQIRVWIFRHQPEMMLQETHQKTHRAESRIKIIGTMRVQRHHHQEVVGGLYAVNRATHGIARSIRKINSGKGGRSRWRLHLVRETDERYIRLKKFNFFNNRCLYYCLIILWDKIHYI